MKKQLTITYEINDGDMTIYGDETTFDPGITIGEIVDVLATTLASFGQMVEADMRPALEAAFNFMYNSSKEQGVWNDGLCVKNQEALRKSNAQKSAARSSGVHERVIKREGEVMSHEQL